MDGAVSIYIDGLFTTSTVNGAGNTLLDERLFGVPLGQHLADGPGTGAVLLFLAVLAALGALAWLMSRRMRRAMSSSAVVPAPGARTAPGAGTLSDAAATINRVLPLLPYMLLPTAAIMPLAANLYLLTTTVWTAVEQGILRRRYVTPRNQG